ncbi:hypothetical protein VIGAN_05250900 [Vigna angularis var. angularis]|uniref:Uncharacterized protein n=1 Tax=Vigna angularis var. angularis TaxID=157739 RepID=A0A0S3S7T2_PHAAN|nr:hypothetical protein VIGAN_05250900 [Vigna angularis var. angularis]
MQILLWKSLELGKAAAKGWLMLPSYWNSDLGMPQNGVRLSGPLLVLVQVAESEKKVMDHRLLELEKQLLDNNDEGEVDAVSMVTTSEWSETYKKKKKSNVRNSKEGRLTYRLPHHQQFNFKD